ncbi:alpha/beta hydrolase [Runella sp.]|uniref:alpha/beta hydrolase n=1 Tax=Runella sp. TaxID=1960881 RepID=UPI002627E22C|nr:alpha/beta hydrolase [Runella sp.]
MKILTFLLTFISLIAMAQPKEINAEQTAIVSSKHWLDIDYVGDDIVGHRLDIHLPAVGKAPFPIVVAIYGSAWFSNSSKSTVFNEGLGQTLLNNGFAVVSINHRSSSDAKFPAQIQDVKAAIRFVRANAAKFSMDNSFIGVTGWSSGGHLTALTGTTNTTQTHSIHGLEVDIEGSLGKYTQTNSKVNAIVDWFGPTDFLIMDACGSSFAHNDTKSPESSLVGGAIQENPDKCALANPISYVNAQNPPFLIFHGDKDPLVPHCQSEKLYEALQKSKVKSELIIIPGGGHGPGVMIEKYYEKMIAFFKEEMGKVKK